MPKGFSEREKASIKAALLEQGRVQFAAYGLRKTNVEELTRSVGISKGAFYLFFDSKEALFLEVLQQFEAAFQADLLAELQRTPGSPQERFHSMMRRAFTLWKGNPLFTRFSQEDFAVLARKLPASQREISIQTDVNFIARLLDELRAGGAKIDAEPVVIANLMRALFFVSLHEKDFDPHGYQPMMELLTGLVAGHVVG